MNTPKKFRICYTAQNGQKSLIYSDDKRYLITLDGKVLENYGKDWKNPFWEEVFDADEQPIIQQYTGLKDKDGKEIYEGDILEWKGEFIAEVFFEQENAAFVIKSKKFGGAFMSDDYVLNFQIIGNIFEHKHLLEK